MMFLGNQLLLQVVLQGLILFSDSQMAILGGNRLVAFNSCLWFGLLIAHKAILNSAGAYNGGLLAASYCFSNAVCFLLCACGFMKADSDVASGNVVLYQEGAPAAKRDVA